MTAAINIAPGLSDPVHAAQTVFRAVMAAFAEPAKPLELPLMLAAPPPCPLSGASAGIALALCDFDTPLFLDSGLADVADVAAYLRFHTGAPLIDQPERAAFAIIADPRSLAALDAFQQGEPEYPDRSTTLIIQIESFGANGPAYDGPGFETRRAFDPFPQIPDFEAQWRRNTALFPLGVDMIFAAPGAVAALPRTAKLSEV